MRRWILVVVTLAMALVAGFVLAARAQEEGPAAAQGAAVDTTGKGYTAAYLIEPTTRRVLLAENADRMLPTASMAKMMTCLIAMEQVRGGRLNLDMPVTISARASTMGGSQIYAKQGQVFTLRALLAAAMVQSANDAAAAIAETVAGSNEAFAALMNERAKELRLTHSVFHDPHGLPNFQDPQQVDQMSAHDLAILGMELMKYPLMRAYAKMPTMPFVNGTFTVGLTNPNHLIQPGKRDYYPPADGIKTGFSEPAGYCITAAARQGDMQLVCVVMGARRSFGPQSSFGIAARLMGEAFAKWVMATPLRKGEPAGTVAVSGGRATTVPAIAGADVRAVVRRGGEGRLQVAVSGGAKAPVRAGDTVGRIQVREEGQVIATLPAVAGASVPVASWWQKLWPF
ncbi:MAG TPA: D-alanyl-D-alanine carboxypeptidase family protein [Thermoanaerobaculia bacterium]|jgi:D-alanyl-D-alanine carboxypeptidase (penicillin-binding protein 5/6)|nr:D-alanyl-D-alanine carboxypeptidase family protein [Thermoanaerobaculia bacterium]